MADKATVRAVPPHFFVGRHVSNEWGAVHPSKLPPGCAFKGCGLPPEHPVHLQPPGDATPERKAANA